MGRLFAGAAAVDITPVGSQFLYGYPHVPRFSTGVHDPLWSSALYLADGDRSVVLIANDVIFVTRELTRRARERIAEATGIPAGHILISATHTHSGPVTVRYLSNEADPVVPEPDPKYLRRLEDGIVAAAQQAYASAQEAVIGLAVANGSSVGTNRRSPSAPRDPEVPVLAVRRPDGGPFVAVMTVCSMHPTVLHEDSTLISGDFPAMTRQYLHEHVVGPQCPVVYHTGPARRVTRGNTFAEAERLGHALGAAIELAIRAIEYRADVIIESRQAMITEMPLRDFPSPASAEAALERAKRRLEQLRQSDAARAEIRTAECDWFGAEETLTLARAAASGRLQAAARSCLPAEVQMIRVGPWSFVGWPGEVFVEFALAVKARHRDTYIISLSNGELQGYLVTAEAAEEGGYEASNALFRSPDGGNLLVEATLGLLEERGGREG